MSRDTAIILPNPRATPAAITGPRWLYLGRVDAGPDDHGSDIPGIPIDWRIDTAAQDAAEPPEAYPGLTRPDSWQVPVPEAAHLRSAA